MRKTLAVAMAATLTAAIAEPMESAAKGGTATLMPAADLKWEDVEGCRGLRGAFLLGDAKKAANHITLKWPARYSAMIPTAFGDCCSYFGISGTIRHSMCSSPSPGKIVRCG